MLRQEVKTHHHPCCTSFEFSERTSVTWATSSSHLPCCTMPAKKQTSEALKPCQLQIPDQGQLSQVSRALMMSGLLAMVQNAVAQLQHEVQTALASYMAVDPVKVVAQCPKLLEACRTLCLSARNGCRHGLAP